MKRHLSVIALALGMFAVAVGYNSDDAKGVILIDDGYQIARLECVSLPVAFDNQLAIVTESWTPVVIGRRDKLAVNPTLGVEATRAGFCPVIRGPPKNCYTS